MELQVRTQLSDEFKKKELDLRQQVTNEANEKAERNSAELQIKLAAHAKELKASREDERDMPGTEDGIADMRNAICAISK